MLEKDAKPIVDFSGGMVTHIDPRLLNQNVAHKLVNCDCSSGKLVPLKEDLPIQDVIKDKGLFFDNSYLEFDKGNYFIKYKNRLYVNNGDIYKSTTDKVNYSDDSTIAWHEENTNAYVRIKVAGYIDSTTSTKYELGRNNPLLGYKDDLKQVVSVNEDYDKYYIKLQKVGFVGTTITVLDEKIVATIDKNTTWTKDKLYDDYSSITGVNEDASQDVSEPKVVAVSEASYCITMYNEEYDLETPPSNIIEVSKETGSTFTFTELPDTGWKVRLYKTTLSGITDFTLVDTIDITSVPYAYTDNTTNLTIAGNHILDSHNNYAIPDRAKYDTLAFATRFVAVDNKIHFSKIGKPYYFPKTSFIEFDENITGIGVIQSGIVIFSKNMSWLVTGTSPTQYSVYQLSKEQGCIDFNTITYLKNQLFWVSNDGICTTSGGQIDIISKEALGYFEDLTKDNPNVCMTTWNEQLILSGYRGVSLIADLRYGMRYTLLDTLYKYLFVDNDTLYGITNNKLVKMFKADANRELEYISPLFTEGALFIPRYLEEFNLVADKDANLSIELTTDSNKIKVESTNLAQSYDKYDIIKYKTKQTVYRDLQVSIKSKGIVYEYIYS